MLSQFTKNHHTRILKDVAFKTWCVLKVKQHCDLLKVTTNAVDDRICCDSLSSLASFDMTMPELYFCIANIAFNAHNSELCYLNVDHAIQLKGCVSNITSYHLISV